MLHCHEESVEDNADGNGEVNKWVHDNQVDDMLNLQPIRKALPDEERVCKLVPAWRTLPLGLLQFCRKKDKKNNVVLKKHNLGACDLF